jgi:hypothetical protein
VYNHNKEKSSHGAGEPGVAPFGVASRTFSTERRKWPSAAMVGWIFYTIKIYKKYCKN